MMLLLVLMLMLMLLRLICGPGPSGALKSTLPNKLRFCYYFRW
jgi:hypothetical protein